MRITFPLALFLVFLVLRLTSVIHWSWWWVTSPLWGVIAVAAAISLGALLLSFIVGSATVTDPGKSRDSKRRGS